jgi:hypothetical protein
MATSTSIDTAKYQLAAGRLPTSAVTNLSKLRAAPAHDNAAKGHRPRKAAAAGYSRL